MSSGGGSGKKSKGSGGWLNCPKCGRRLPRALHGKHSVLVGLDAASEKCSGTVFPFIIGGALYANLGKVTVASKIGSLPFIKTQRLASSTIFLPDELIRESGLKTFSWVFVSSADAAGNAGDAPFTPPIALRIWPIPGESNPSLAASPAGSSTSISYSTVMLTSDGFLSSRFNPLTLDAEASAVRIQPLVDPSVVQALLPAARLVTLELDSLEGELEGFLDPERFAQSFKKAFRGRVVLAGNQFRLRFYTDVISFRVKTLEILGARGDDLDPGVTRAMRGLCLGGGGGGDNAGEKVEFVFGEIGDECQVVVELSNAANAEPRRGRMDVMLKEVGGLDAVVKEVCSTIKFIFGSTMNVAKGILIYGHSGTGKSFLVDAICTHFNLHRAVFNEFSVSISKESSSSRTKSSSSSLMKVFQEAESKLGATTEAPSAIIIENLDLLAAKKLSGSQSSFIMNLHSLIPSLSLSKNVIIFATATEPDGIDVAVRSPQIFGKELELPVPSVKERGDILGKVLVRSGFGHKLTEVELKEVAGATHGFVGADLRGLVTQAAQNAVERSAQDEGGLGKVLEMGDFSQALKIIKPSAIKSILVDVPDVRWDDIGGMSELKFKLKQAIEWPLKHPEAFLRLGITPPKGILMYGPPGCSKTMIAKAIATESGLNFISVKGSELFSKWVGESEKAVRDVFRKARQVAPCVVFFDEIDSLGGERGSTSGSSNVHERVLAQLLVEIDGVEPLKDVTIVAATNRPDIIDQALLRPGRLDRIIYVPLPDSDTRRDILKIRMRKMPIDPSVNVDKIVEATVGYSGAELTAVCHEAAMKSLEENIENSCISETHFDSALEIIRPRIDKEQIQFYDNYSKNHKRL